MAGIGVHDSGTDVHDQRNTHNEKDRAARGYQSKRVERAKKIVELHRAGLSLRQISVVVGCGKSTVADELRAPLLIAIDSLS